MNQLASVIVKIRRVQFLRITVYKSLVLNLAVNYRNWVMGPFDLDNGLFF